MYPPQPPAIRQASPVRGTTWLTRRLSRGGYLRSQLERTWLGDPPFPQTSQPARIYSTPAARATKTYSEPPWRESFPHCKGLYLTTRPSSFTIRPLNSNIPSGVCTQNFPSAEPRFGNV